MYDPDDPIDDPFNPINTYTPYSLIGNSAVDVGRLWGTTAIPGADQIMNVCGPYCFGIFRPSVSIGDMASVIENSNQAMNNSLNLLSAITSGNFNEYAYGGLFLPGSWGNTINSGFIPGVGFPSFNPNATIDSWLGYTPTFQPIYTPVFLNSYVGFTNSPWGYISPIPVFPSYTTCTAANYLQPTIITFRNFSLNPVAVFRLNDYCQEVFENVVPIGGFTTAVAFANETWIFRYATTIAPIVNPVYLVQTTNPVVDFVPVAAGQAEARQGSMQSDPQLAQANGSRLAAAQATYRSIGEIQLAIYYNNPSLISLRQEANQYLQRLLFSDPLYLFWGQEANDLAMQIRSSRPSYNAYNTLRDQVRGFAANPTTDPAVLRERSAARQQLQALQQQLDAEVATYLAEQPELKQQIASLSARLDNRIEELWSQPQVVLWDAEWQQRWNAAFANAAGLDRLQQTVAYFEDQFPEFAEYVRLQREVNALLPAFDDMPVVDQAARQQDVVRDDATLANRITTLTEGYQETVEGLIGPSSIPETIEQYYSESSALAAADPTYRDLEARGAANQEALAAHQRAVARAVALCFSQSDDCDPLTDEYVRLVVSAGRPNDLSAASGAFYEQQDRFWYTFYRSEAYLNFENGIKERLIGPISDIQGDLDAARANLKEAVEDQPELVGLRGTNDQVIEAICSQSASLSGLPIADPTAALCERIDRMAAIADELRASGENLQLTVRYYLPLLAQ